MRRAIGCGALGWLLSAAAAQTQPDAAGILKKVGETYKAASQYELAARLYAGGNGAGPTGHMRFAFKAPNRYRMEGAMPGMMAGAAGSNGAVAVHDGAALWFYLPESNQYLSIPASELTEDAPGDLGDARPEAMDRFIMIRYRGAAEYAPGAKMVREEAVDFGGAKAQCYVVTFTEKEGKTVYTWWIEKGRYRILREDHAGTSTVYTTIKLNEPLPDALFKFVPPAGARKVELTK